MAKYEFVNPFSAVNDRTAFGMFCEAINLHYFSLGSLKLLDVSGGKMGNALAKLGQLYGIPIHMIIPDSSLPPLVAFRRAAGVELSTVESRFFPLGLIISRAHAISLHYPSWTVLLQHLNLVNIAVHQYQTEQEIRRQLEEEKAAGWMVVGTGGTLSGVYAVLVQDNPVLTVRGTTSRELSFGTYNRPNGGEKFSVVGSMGFGFSQLFIAHVRLYSVQFYEVNWQESLNAMYEFFIA